MASNFLTLPTKNSVSELIIQMLNNRMTTENTSGAWKGECFDISPAARRHIGS